MFSERPPDVSLASLRRLAGHVLAAEHATGAGRVSLALVSDATMRALHARHLGRRRTTDVLAFPFGESGFLGEVVVSTDRARVQARAYAVSYEEELSRLVVHGLLHLLGHDDGTAREAAGMHRRENRYLKTEWRIREKRTI